MGVPAVGFPRQLLFLHTLLIVVVLSATGCGKKDAHDRSPLAGTVTFQGQPLDKGTIQFLPPDPATGFSAMALITDGRYSIPREQGLPPGTYKVLITSPEPSKEAPVEPPGAPGMKMTPLGVERIPAEYNTATKLTAEVTSSGEINTFNFVIP